MPVANFELGQIVATPGALEALAKAGRTAAELLSRHASGDWGSVCDEDGAANDSALEDGTRILSVYELASEVKVWAITEADRSSTCILLPEEY
ncbi:hypothetical protein [Candidatus Laterigemmans baculatus]|uniref:hypothetical protein n=1 Tax=Candidatus Laterigemmans baculatus TaxID=2770505 RepID=UPI0013DA5C3B|nr:hypothetical protein [Candidatus Laterigemmans baculatus]